jgi:hypothetical protein
MNFMFIDDAGAPAEGKAKLMGSTLLLDKIASFSNWPHSLVLRAAGVGTMTIQTGEGKPTICRWQARFMAEGIRWAVAWICDFHCVVGIVDRQAGINRYVAELTKTQCPSPGPLTPMPLSKKSGAGNRRQNLSTRFRSRFAARCGSLEYGLLNNKPFRSEQSKSKKPHSVRPNSVGKEPRR